MAKIDPYAFGTAHMSQRDWMKKQLSAESKMKMFGTDARAKNKPSRSRGRRKN